METRWPSLTDASCDLMPSRIVVLSFPPRFPSDSFTLPPLSPSVSPPFLLLSRVQFFLLPGCWHSNSCELNTWAHTGFSIWCLFLCSSAATQPLSLRSPDNTHPLFLFPTSKIPQIVFFFPLLFFYFVIICSFSIHSLILKDMTGRPTTTHTHMLSHTWQACSFIYFQMMSSSAKPAAPCSKRERERERGWEREGVCVEIIGWRRGGGGGCRGSDWEIRGEIRDVRKSSESREMQEDKESEGRCWKRDKEKLKRRRRRRSRVGDRKQSLGVRLLLPWQPYRC